MDQQLDTPGLARQRLTFTTTASALFGQIGRVPLLLFPHFLRVVDREIAMKVPLYLPSPLKYYGGCSLDLSGLQGSYGDYGVFLNGAFIFVIRATQVVPLVFDFNCGLLKNDQPTLTIRNLRENDSSDLLLTNPKIRFQTFMSDHQFILSETLRPDKSVRVMSGLLD